MVSHLRAFGKERSTEYLSLPHFVAALKDLRDFVELAGGGRDARIASLRGQPGVGKSMLVEELFASYPEYMENGIMMHPMIYLNLKGNPSIRDILASCLAQIGLPLRQREPAGDMINRLSIFVAKLKVRVIVLDEFQHLASARGTSREGLCDTVKAIMNICKCAVLAVGTEKSLDVIMHDQQISSRCILHKEIEPFDDWEGGVASKREPDQQRPPNFLEFQSVVKAFVKSHRFPQPSNLEVGESVKTLYFASGGVMRNLWDLINWAARISRENKDQKITDKALKSAIEKMQATSTKTRSFFEAIAVELEGAKGGKAKAIKGGRVLSRVAQASQNIERKLNEQF